ncbi:MAG TPA: hypothetical protein VJ724_01250 [Tahibacter sp.]|nr:hypothetical protein [Tahibacter sp.]
MPATLAKLLLALAAGAAPDAAPNEIAVLTDGTRVARPTQWVSLRTEMPALYGRWRDALDRGEQLQLTELFVAPSMLAEWRESGDTVPRPGTNLLFVAQCPKTLSDGMPPDHADLDAMAQAMREEALARQQREKSAGKKTYDVAFGPSRQAHSVVSVIRKEAGWGDDHQIYLLSNAAFWLDSRCLTLMLNGKEESMADVPRLIERTERLVEETRAAATAR